MPKRKRQTPPDGSEDNSLVHRVMNDAFYYLTPYLNVNAVIACSATCRMFKGLFDDTLLWKQRYQQDIGLLYFDEDYKAQYIAEVLTKKMLNSSKTGEGDKYPSRQQQIQQHLDSYKDKPWISYYFTLLHIDEDPNTVDYAMQALAKTGDLRLAFCLISYFSHRYMACRFANLPYDDTKVQLGYEQTFAALSALINNNTPILMNDYERLNLALNKMPRHTDRETTTHFYFMKAFCLLYCKKSQHHDNRTYATKLYTLIAYTYLRDDVKNFFRFTRRVASAMYPRIAAFAKSPYERGLLQASNTIEAAGASLPLSIRNRDQDFLLAYLLECSTQGHAAATYHYARHLAENLKINESISYYLKAIEAKEYRAASSLYYLICIRRNKIKLVGENRLDDMLREGIQHGDVSCIHAMALKIKNSHPHPWDEDPYSVWILQMSACMSNPINEKTIGRFDILFDEAFNVLTYYSKQTSTSIFIDYALAMILALKAGDDGSEELPLPHLTIDEASFQAYLAVGKEHGFYTTAHDLAAQRIVAASNRQSEEITDEDMLRPRFTG